MSPTEHLLCYFPAVSSGLVQSIFRSLVRITTTGEVIVMVTLAVPAQASL